MRRTYWQYLRRYFGMGVTVDKELSYTKYAEILSTKWGLLVRALRNFHEKHYYRVSSSLKGLAAEGHPVAQYFAAVSILKSDRKASNVQELLWQSANAGFTPAMYKLGKMLINTSQVTEGKTLMSEAAEAGHAKAIAYCGLYDLPAHELALVCSALNVSKARIYWLHAFVLLNRWRDQNNGPKRDIIESICFIAPPTATNEELAVFRDIVYDGGAQSIKWLEENASELMRLNCE